MADFKFIAYDDQGDVLRIAINRPPYNVLDIATMEEMNTALDMAMANRTAKLLVITGNGDKAFSSGVDVMDHTPDKVVKMIDVFHGILKRLMMVPIPTVAAVNGPALGGGCSAVPRGGAPAPVRRRPVAAAPRALRRCGRALAIGLRRCGGAGRAVAAWLSIRWLVPASAYLPFGRMALGFAGRP